MKLLHYICCYRRLLNMPIIPEKKRKADGLHREMRNENSTPQRGKIISGVCTYLYFSLKKCSESQIL